VEFITPTRQRMLDILPAGQARERSPLSPRMAAVLQAARQRYRHTVVDLPSVMSSDAAAQMASLCDTVVFVCQANQLRVEAAQQTLRQLREAGAVVSLAVLNKRRYPVPDWAYQMT
jgi:Mrp family chromosome partitioning ATPase